MCVLVPHPCALSARHNANARLHTLSANGATATLTHPFAEPAQCPQCPPTPTRDPAALCGWLAALAVLDSEEVAVDTLLTTIIKFADLGHGESFALSPAHSPLHASARNPQTAHKSTLISYAAFAGRHHTHKP